MKFSVVFQCENPGSAFDLILQTSEFDQLSRVLIVFEEIRVDNDKFEICIPCQQNQQKVIECPVRRGFLGKYTK